MKCIYKKYTWRGNNLDKCELFTENCDGTNRQLLLRSDADGFKTFLTVKPSGFVLKNLDGEIIRQGTETDVFAIYDSMLFDGRPMRVNDEIKDVIMSFDDYEKAFGIDRVDRDIKRKFNVYCEKLPDGHIIAGITEYDRFDIFAVHSLCMPQIDVNYVADIIAKQLFACEFASVNAVGLNINKLDAKYAGIVRMYQCSYTKKFEHARLLALSKTNASKVFDEPVSYRPQGLFDEEVIA